MKLSRFKRCVWREICVQRLLGVYTRQSSNKRPFVSFLIVPWIQSMVQPKEVPGYLQYLLDHLESHTPPVNWRAIRIIYNKIKNHTCRNKRCKPDAQMQALRWMFSMNSPGLWTHIYYWIYDDSPMVTCVKYIPKSIYEIKTRKEILSIRLPNPSLRHYHLESLSQSHSTFSQTLSRLACLDPGLIRAGPNWMSSKSRRTLLTLKNCVDVRGYCSVWVGVFLQDQL